MPFLNKAMPAAAWPFRINAIPEKIGTRQSVTTGRLFSRPSRSASSMRLSQSSGSPRRSNTVAPVVNTQLRRHRRRGSAGGAHRYRHRARRCWRPDWRRGRARAGGAPDRGANLRDFLDRRKAIEPRHQRVTQGERDRQGACPSGILPTVAGIPEVGGFEDRLGQLLDEQRHAVGLAEDLFQQIRGQRLAAAEPRDQRTALRPGELVELQRRDVTVMRPARGKLRPVSQHDQERNVPNPSEAM
jgi:hypothetical protein